MPPPAVDPSALGADEHVLSPQECASVASGAAELVDLSSLERADEGMATLLWRNDVSEAWLNTWWTERDSGFHDHDGSCGGVHVLAGEVTGEPLVVGGSSRARTYRAGDSFSFAGDAIHRVDHHRGAVTVHVYSPPLRSIGHYELVDGELHRTPCSPDDVSGPSEALTEALRGSIGPW